MIKVLIIEDSRVVQEFLAHVLSSDPAIQVIGFANDGSQALQAVEKNRPDVVTMDIHMPKMDGFEATRSIMENIPTPIVIVSASTSAKESATTFRALEAGALAVVRRPPGFGHPEYAAVSKDLITTVKLMSEVRVVKRIKKHPEKVHESTPIIPVQKIKTGFQLIAIGASTGGPPVLQNILSRLPLDLDVPVLIVQHITSGFIPGFVEWLASASRFPVHIAKNGDQPMPAHAYIAPDGFRMGIAAGPRIVLSAHPSENHLRPSVAFLFRTVAEILGKNAIGVLLTGMGKDGAEELKLIKQKGGLTLVQDEASSIVFGMPGEAVKLGAATYVLSPEEIASMLVAVFEKNKKRNL